MTDQRLIDAEPIKKFIVDGLNNPDLKKAFGHDAIEILAEIEYAPTVDAVEVVRCKDCIGWCSEEIAKQYGVDRYCTLTRIPTNADDFCSYGERRTDHV